MAVEVVGAVRAVAEIGRGDTVMVGGFGLVGAPLTLIEALVRSDEARELTVISNNLGEPGKGLGARCEASARCHRALCRDGRRRSGRRSARRGRATHTVDERHALSLADRRDRVRRHGRSWGVQAA
jgi:acyl CoA:acetate/3-ketoacid CoA transferase alpha subunit